MERVGQVLALRDIFRSAQLSLVLFMWRSITDVLISRVAIATHDLCLVDSAIAGRWIGDEICHAQRLSRHDFFGQLGHLLQLLLDNILLEMVLVETGRFDHVP